MSAAPVTIIGAGLGGLSAALALQRAGWPVQVCEQAPVLGEAGAGISLSAGCCRALATLGIGAELQAASMPAPDVAFVHYRSGALLAGRLDLGRPPDRGFDGARHIHRADLHAILLRAVSANDAGAVQTGKRLLHVEAGARGVSAHFADGSRAVAGLLLAADGVRSAVRRQCFDDSPPQFCGQVAYRCLVPRAAAEPFLGAGNALVTVGPARIFHRYRLRGGALVNVVAIAQSRAWHGEGWNTAATVAEFAAAYQGFGDDVRGLIGEAPPASLIKWALFVRPPLARWVRGTVALLGDAAHPVLPFLGLGAALAIEDGIVLARALRASDDIASALAVYQRARCGRVDAVRRQSIVQGQLLQATDPDRDGCLRHSPAQDARLFDYDASLAPLDA